MEHRKAAIAEKRKVGFNRQRTGFPCLREGQQCVFWKRSAGATMGFQPERGNLHGFDLFNKRDQHSMVSGARGTCNFASRGSARLRPGCCTVYSLASKPERETHAHHILRSEILR